MADSSSPGAPPPAVTADDRLDSWKEIAGYLKRDVTTVQRWEKREGMPVHRHVHDKAGSVYAFRRELDAWAASRRAEDPERIAEATAPQTAPATAPGEPADEVAPVAARRPAIRRIAAGAAVLVAAAWGLWMLSRLDARRDDGLEGARFVQLTNFGGHEHGAALSRDGRVVAFLSDRGGRMDLWVGQVGSGQFYNLTQGTSHELVNPSLRNLGFSPDGSVVTFWARRLQPSNATEINIWGVPVLGGAPRPYLEGIAEFDWSPDGKRLVYHTPGPGDPMFIKTEAPSSLVQIFSAAPGLHAHFPVWSPDGRFVYFVQGSLPDRMDIWRIAAAGGPPERITRHDSRVSHPVFADDRLLLYLASDEQGGPWLFSIDVEQRESRRVSSGVDRYASLAGTADGSRLVATVSNPGSALWRMPLSDSVDTARGRQLALTTVSGSLPRLGPDYVLYVASKGDSDSIWKLEGDRPTELWTAPGMKIGSAPVVDREGGRIAFVALHDQKTTLFVADADGTNARAIAASLQLQGSPAWAPDGRSVTVAAVADGMPRLFAVPLDGGPPSRLVGEHALDPVWSPDGRLLAYSGPDVGTTFEVKFVTANGGAASVRPFTLSRGSRHLAFTHDGRSVIVLRGDISRKDLWEIELETGRERQLSRFASDFIVRDFDLSPDGRDIVVEQVRERSDIVLIERARR